MRAKNEYHRRVSPIVLSGGLSRLIQSPMMNAARTVTAEDDNIVASIRGLPGQSDLFPSKNAAAAPAAERRTEVSPNQMKLFQLIISSAFTRSLNEKKSCTCQHHYDSCQCRVFPRFMHQLKYAPVSIIWIIARQIKV